MEVARDSLRTAATPSCQMYDTMTTRQAGCVSNFSTEILAAQHEQGILQVSAYIRGATGTVPEMRLDVLGI
jgi:hypothetical protein